jgi:hypothetical protein
MKKTHGSLASRLAAFAVLLSFTAASCPQYSSPDTAPPPQKQRPLYPVSVIPQSGQQPTIPVSFYLSDDYEPTETDTGKTAFALSGDKTLEKFLATSEERGNGAVARFLDGESGTSVAVYFTGGEPFPASFTLDSEEGAVSGFFSAYHEETETFALTLQCGAETYGPFESFTLNKNVFGLYQDDKNLTAGKNVRIRNYITALSVWTSMTYWLNKQMTEMEDAERGLKKAMENICEIGAVITVAAGAFEITAAKAVSVATDIGIVIAAPVVAAVPVAVPIAVTHVTLADIGENEANEEPAEPPLPPAKLKAPRFDIYYLDEAGGQQPLPVMRGGQTPEIGEEFYIRPHGTGIRNATSIVKFYFKVASVETTDGEVKTSLVFSPEDDPYLPVSVKADEGGNYFEIKKYDGFRSFDSIKTTLTIKVFNGTATTDSEHPVYFPCYYVNGEEFTGGEGFVINFIDKISPDEESQVRIPQRTISETPGTYNIEPVLPVLDRLVNRVGSLPPSYPFALPLM